MDIFFNLDLVEKKAKSKAKMKLKSNGGTNKVYHQATVNGYHNSVWFSENAITFIIALRNLHLYYLVTYRSIEMMFIVHVYYEGKPNMQFIMHASGLYYFNPRDKEFNFVNTVSKNKEGFTSI